MAIFHYKAVAAGGRNTTGTVRAESLLQARRMLREQGQFILDLQEVAEDAPGPRGASSFERFIPGRGNRRRLTDFTRELSVLLASALPLKDALECCQETAADPEVQGIIAGLQDQIRSGKSLADAMEGNDFFPPLYRNLVRLGEANGTLAQVMTRLAQTLYNQQRLTNKILAASFQPMMSVGVGIFGVAFLLVYVLPNLIDLLGDPSQLPLVTRLLLAIYGFLTSWWAVAAGVGVVLLVWYVLRWRTAHRVRWDRGLLRLPGVGGLVQLNAASRFSRSMAILVRSGTPVLESLETTLPTVGNAAIEADLRGCIGQLREGATLADTVGTIDAFPPLLRRLIRVGERTGTLDEVLEHCADHFEERLGERLELLPEATQPVLIIGIALVMGFVAVAILLPILEVSGGF